MRFAPRSIPLPLRWTGLGASPARAGASTSTVNGSWSDTELDVAVAHYVVTIAATPADAKGSFPGTEASKTVGVVKITVQVSDSPGQQTPADPDDETGSSCDGHGPAPVLNDPADYLPHITPLGLDPAHWTTSVVQPWHRVPAGVT